MIKPTNAARAIVIALLAGLLALAGCSSGDEQPEAPGHSEHYDPGDSGLPAGTAATVYTEALTAIFTWEPATQDSPSAALQSAKKYLTGQALADANSPARVRMSAEWSAWRANQDIVTAVVGAPQIVDRGDGTATGRSSLTQIVQHTDGTTTPLRRSTASAQLVKVAGTWKLSTYPTTDA